VRKIIPVLHNVTSPHRVVEFVTLAASLGFKNIVISKPSGSAAQMGVPQAFKAAIQLKANLIVLSDLSEIKELLAIERMYFVLSPRYAEKKLVEEEFPPSKDIAVIFGGMEPGITVREAEMGIKTHVGVPATIGPVALAAITLYLIRSKLVEWHPEHELSKD